MATAMTIEERRARLQWIVGRLREIDNEFSGLPYTEQARSEWNELHSEREEHLKVIEELEVRMEAMREAEGDPERQEPVEDRTTRPTGERGKQRGARGGDIYDLTTVPRDYVDPAGEARELRDRAMRSLDSAVFGHEQADPDSARAHVERLLDGADVDDAMTVDERTERSKAIARRMLITGNPAYKRAFGKYVAGREQSMTGEERAALAVGAGGTGGFAIVYTLDPTLIPTSNGSVNPWRQIARVETIAGTNEWRGVTVNAITAAYANEAAEASDNSPTLIQPAVVVNRAQAFVPFSIEISQDWGALQSEMATLIQDAKDDLEANQFYSGSGVAPNPSGILTGATVTTGVTTASTFGLPDVYKMEESIPPRFRQRAEWVANRSIWNRVRQFDTAGGAALWLRLPQGMPNTPVRPGAGANLGNTGAEILGYPAWEASAMTTAVTTTSGPLIVAGDFRYFIIVDRVGLDVEVVPHLFGGSNRFPTGQRGLYAMWRNNSKVLSTSAFRVLVATT